MKEYRLGDIIDIKHGYAFDGEHIVQDDNGIVLVTPGNFRIGGGFQEEKCKFFTGEIPKDYVLSAGDYIVTMTDLSKEIDTLGYSAIVPKSNRTYLHNQRIGLISFKNDECYTGYIYFLMRTHLYQRSIANTSTGATVHHTSPAKIYDYRFSAPDYETQRKIADYLFAYEKLIENNQKQIKLLEEAAQRLYKEWFVDLRFPGHETTPITDGIPEGWRETTIGDETEVKRGGSPRPIQEYLSDEGLNWLKISDATASNSPFIYQIKEKIKPEGLRKTVFMKAGTIILSNSATPGIPKILKIDTCIHDGWLYFPNLQLSNEYMYHLFLQIRSDLVSRATGAVFTNLRTDILKGYRFIKPDDYILDLFNKQVKPIFSEIDCLHQQVLLLTEARDRLLPKLMNGEIEV